MTFWLAVYGSISTLCMLGLMVEGETRPVTIIAWVIFWPAIVFSCLLCIAVLSVVGLVLGEDYWA